MNSKSETITAINKTGNIILFVYVSKCVKNCLIQLDMMKRDMFLKAHLLSTNTPDNARTLIMVQCSAYKGKQPEEGWRRRTQLTWAPHSLTRRTQRASHSHGLGGTQSGDSVGN